MLPDDFADAARLIASSWKVYRHVNPDGSVVVLDIVRGLALFGSRPPSVDVPLLEREQFYEAAVDPAHAMALPLAALDVPVLVADIPVPGFEGQSNPVVVDGCHRCWRALRAGRSTLPGILLSREETLLLVIPPEMLTSAGL